MPSGLNKWNINSELQIDGYNLCANDLDEMGRGIAVYISTDIYCNQIYVESVFKDFVIIELSLDEKSIFGNFYRSPNGTAESDEELRTLISSISSQFTCNKDFVGYFNFTAIDWATSSKITYSCTVCNKFVDIL